MRQISGDRAFVAAVPSSTCAALYLDWGQRVKARPWDQGSTNVMGGLRVKERHWDRASDT